ncbi:MAG TPA: indolepyruvate ferredoxin oxidoreductase family protein [Burkholderiales bacterium]
MRAVDLDDKYLLEEGTVYLSGTQALVRVLLEQRRRDARAGLNTAGFVSGYRGSPLGGVDFALWRAEALLKASAIRFEPGLNEELAATMVHGSQQVGEIDAPRVDGVFGLFYAKNPGVDRAGDALKHANAAGTAPHGGVLAVSGDDPRATSSSIANQCDHAFISAAIPVLAPASVADILDYGLFGYGLSRYAGVWVALKTVADVVESSAAIAVGASRPLILPEMKRPPDGWGLRWPDSRWDQDARLLGFRLPATRAYARANRLDRIVFGAARPRLGIVTAGKAANDVLEALALLGIDQRRAEALGLAVYKVGMVWPLEPQGMREFAEGLDEIVVVEERRSIVETQLKEQAYHWPADRRPRVVGKTDETGAPLLPEGGVLTPHLVAHALASRLGIEFRLRPSGPPSQTPELIRTPHFCPGCPHARSTRVPEGSIAMAGIGCHSLRLGMPDPKTMFMVQMGGEGTNWLGAAPFVTREHVFQNLGDGTYTHSGSLAVRAAVAAGARMTFRILYNSAVAMTGGQPAEGALTLGQITRQLAAEGVARTVVVAEDPGQASGLAPGVEVFGRESLDRVQRELREAPGVTALVYDQRCAIEKRRLRKKGSLPAIAARVFINERVCEGCGDCVVQSQCAAVLPVETALGTKRRIDQSGCNADLSCLEGFCPSFVTLEGARPRAHALPQLDISDVPEPRLPPLEKSGEIVVTGIGGAGVITVGAILGMAAHLEGRGCSVLDNTGIARKGGAVSSHIRLAERPGELHGTHIADGQATLLMGGDLVVSAESSTLSLLAPNRTQAMLNSDAVPTLNQRLDPMVQFDSTPLRCAIERTVGADAVSTVSATRIAERLLGDAIFANMVLLGAAWQRGMLPLSRAAIEKAIDLNGNAAAANQRAFALGRMAVHDFSKISSIVNPGAPVAEDLDAVIAHRVAFLTAYQDQPYAQRYFAFVAKARVAESTCVSGDALARAVADGYFRLLAVKDEYEVARLYTDGEFRRELESRFEGPWRMRYHLSPPLFARTDPNTGRPRKYRFGPWLGPVLSVLARLRGLRGTWLDPFGHTAERRLERKLLADYEREMGEALAGLTPESHARAVELAALPARMRGFGPVKAANVAAALATK